MDKSLVGLGALAGIGGLVLLAVLLGPGGDNDQANYSISIEDEQYSIDKNEGYDSSSPVESEEGTNEYIYSKAVKSEPRIKADWDTSSVISYFHSPWIEILPDTDFSELGAGVTENPLSISLVSTVDEYESATLSLKALRNIRKLTGEVEDLTTLDGKKIPKKNIDVRVVKVWEQGGRSSITEEEPTNLAELLMYNDNDQLLGGWEHTGEFGEGVVGNAYHFKNNILDIPFEVEEPVRDFTIDFRYKPDYNGDNNDSKRTSFFLDLKERSFIEFFSNTKGRYTALINNQGSRSLCSFNYSEVFVKNEWVRLTVVWEKQGKSISIYTDGKVPEKANCKPVQGLPIRKDEYTLRFGDRTGVSSADGWLDQFLFYDYAASEEEVRKKDYSPENLLLFYNFESDQQVKNNKGILRSSKYNPPTISTALSVDIPKNTAKTLWFTINVPEDQDPGVYEGTFLLKDAKGEIAKVPLSVTVLPFSLDEPSHIRGIVYNGRIRPGEKTIDNFKKDLDDIYEHGFRSYRGPIQSDLVGDKIAEIIKEKGFVEPLISSGIDIEDDLAAFEKLGYTPYVSGFNEPHRWGLDWRMEEHIRKSKEIHDKGGLVAIQVSFEASELLADKNSRYYDLVDNRTGKTFRDNNVYEPVDLAIYHAGWMYKKVRKLDQAVIDYTIDLRSGKREKNDFIELYYYNIWYERPLYDRTVTGFFLWTSGFDGTSAWTYWWPANFAKGGDPYDDFDNNHCNEFGKNCNQRDYHLVYPANPENIPTIQWEASREGIDDLRYLTTLDNLLKEKERKHSKEVSQIREELEERLSQFYEPRDLAKMTGEDFDIMRLWIIEQILLLEEL